MINITLGVFFGYPSMKYPKNGFKIINITQIPKMNPAMGFCFIVHWSTTMDSSSDEDFVSSRPSTSRGRGKQRGRTDIPSSSEPPAKLSKAEMTRLRVAKHRAKSVILTEEQQKAKRENQRKRTAECRRKKAQDQLDV